MEGDVDPARELLTVAGLVTPRWLWRCVDRAARAGGVAIGGDDPELVTMIDTTTIELLDQLERLLSTDVDAQRQNPLSVFRDATSAPTALLAAPGATCAARDRFAIETFPADIYGLAPASWTDIDPELHDPGIAWGAWKAMTVIRRHRP